MNTLEITNIFDSIDPDYKDLVFGEFFDQIREAFISGLSLDNTTREEVDYLLTLYFIFVINRYQLIENVALILNSPVNFSSDLVLKMLNNLPKWLVDSIETTYLEGINDESFLNKFKMLSTLNKADLDTYLQMEITKKASGGLLAGELTPKKEIRDALQITNSLRQEIEQAEKDFVSLQTVRTMPHDMAAIKPGSDVVYQLSQADILRTPTPAAPTVVPEATRWETDTKQ